MKKTSFVLLRQAALLLLGLVVAVGAGFLATSHAPTPLAHAATGSLSGYAWSGNTGWISMSGVTINTDNTLSGYAWGGGGVGWISFNAAEVTPTCGTPGPTISGSTLSGWARALYGVGSDGCISLSGSGYGVVLDGTSHYAWASDTLGWIDFSQVTYSASSLPTCTLTGPPSPVQAGSPTTISWETTNATSGSIDHGVGNATPIANGSTNITAPPTTTTYIMTVIDSSSVTNTCSATVTINTTPVPVVTIVAAPNSGPTPLSPTITWSSTNSPTSCTASDDWSGPKDTSAGNHTQQVGPLGIGNYKYTLTCVNTGGNSAPASTNVQVNPPSSPSISGFYAIPSRVRSGNTSTLNWNIANYIDGTTVCTISSNPSGGIASPYTVSVGSTTSATAPSTNGITKTTEFTLDCGANGAGKATVTIVPTFQEI